jgi:hypothetical protein
MSSVRTWHTYIGLLIAPSVLFFCTTGALQLFSLHEAHGSYQPPMLMEKLGKLHKDQVFAVSEHHAPQPEAKKNDDAGAAAKPDDNHDEPAVATFLLKCFFLLVALGLMTSTVLGTWMALTHIRHKRVAKTLLVAGVLVPVLLVFV